MEGNIDINEKEGYAWISINPKIYPMHVIYSAAYTFIDKCYVLVDGDPDEEILVELRPKNESDDLRILARELNNELLNYANYSVQSSRNAVVRELILKRVLLTNQGSKSDSKDKDSTGTGSKPWEQED